MDIWLLAPIVGEISKEKIIILFELKREYHEFLFLYIHPLNKNLNVTNKESNENSYWLEEIKISPFHEGIYQLILPIKIKAGSYYFEWYHKSNKKHDFNIDNGKLIYCHQINLGSGISNIFYFDSNQLPSTKIWYIIGNHVAEIFEKRASMFNNIQIDDSRNNNDQESGKIFFLHLGEINLNTQKKRSPRQLKIRDDDFDKRKDDPEKKSKKINKSASNNSPFVNNIPNISKSRNAMEYSRNSNYFQELLSLENMVIQERYYNFKNLFRGKPFLSNGSNLFYKNSDNINTHDQYFSLLTFNFGNHYFEDGNLLIMVKDYDENYLRRLIKEQKEIRNIILCFNNNPPIPVPRGIYGRIYRWTEDYFWTKDQLIPFYNLLCDWVLLGGYDKEQLEYHRHVLIIGNFKKYGLYALLKRDIITIPIVVSNSSSSYDKNLIKKGILGLHQINNQLTMDVKVAKSKASYAHINFNLSNPRAYLYFITNKNPDKTSIDKEKDNWVGTLEKLPGSSSDSKIISDFNRIQLKSFSQSCKDFFRDS